MHGRWLDILRRSIISAMPPHDRMSFKTCSISALSRNLAQPCLSLPLMLVRELSLSLGEEKREGEAGLR